MSARADRVRSAVRSARPARGLSALLDEVTKGPRQALKTTPIPLIGFDGQHWRPGFEGKKNAESATRRLRILSWNLSAPPAQAMGKDRFRMHIRRLILQDPTPDIVLLQRCPAPLVFDELMQNEAIKQDWLMSDWSQTKQLIFSAASARTAPMTCHIMLNRQLPFECKVSVGQFRRQGFRAIEDERPLGLLMLTLSWQGKEVARIGTAELAREDRNDTIRRLQLLDCIATLGQGSSPTGPACVLGISHSSDVELLDPIAREMTEVDHFLHRPTNHVFYPHPDTPPRRVDHFLVSTGKERSIGSKVEITSPTLVGAVPVPKPGTSDETRLRHVYGRHKGLPFATRRPGLLVPIQLPPFDQITPRTLTSFL